MPKLTNSMRDSIIETEIKKSFHEKLLELERDFKLAVQEQAKKELPKCLTEEVISSGFLNTNSQIKVIGLTGLYSYRNKTTEFVEIFDYLPAPQYSNFEIKCTKTIQAKCDKWQKLIEEEKSTRQKLRQALYSFNTDKQLLEAFPELKDYFKNQLSSSTAVIPYEQIKEVKKFLKSNQGN